MVTPGPGLCSVTFRDRTPDQVLALAVDAGLGAIEWGSDVHLPPGDVDAAEALRRRCEDAGVACPSYGSYHAAGAEVSQPLEAVLESAAALGCATVRIWCAWGTEPDAPEADRERVADGVRAAAAAAAEHGLSVSLEFHPGTLTATADGARWLLDRVDDERVFTYWQPRPGRARREAIAELRAVAADLSHLHVFTWAADGTRLDLAAGEPLWRGALDVAAEGGRWVGRRWAYLEFVRDDDPEQLQRDAASLRRWLGRETGA